MEVKKMRTCVDGNTKFVKKVFKKQNGVLVPVYDFSEIGVGNGIYADSVVMQKGYIFTGSLDYNYTNYIYDINSVLRLGTDVDTFEYEAFEIEYELKTYVTATVTISGYYNKIIEIQKSSGTIETLQGKFSSKFKKGRVILEDSTKESGYDYFDATFIKVDINADTSTSSKESWLADVFSIKNLTFIK